VTSERPVGRHLRVAQRVAAALGEAQCLLAGGLAVSAHGYVRATHDVDLVTRLSLSEARVKLDKRGLKTELLGGDIVEGGFACLRGESEDLPFDILPELVPIHWDKAVRIGSKSTVRLRVVGLDDLLALKLKAQGPKDLLDAAMLVLLHPESEAHAKELATAYRALDRFEQVLDHPRTRAQAREEAQLDSRLSRKRGTARTVRATPKRRRR